jgi:hypothetical protein
MLWHKSWEKRDVEQTMNEEAITSRPQPFRQFSLRTMLLVVLLICTFLAGRASVQPELSRARAEAERARKKAEQGSVSLELIRAQLARVISVPRRFELIEPPRWNVDRGMMIDALEHEQRFQRSGVGPQY